MPTLWCALDQVYFDLADLASSGKSLYILVKILQLPIVIKVHKVIYKLKSHNFVKIGHRRVIGVCHHKCQVETSICPAGEGGLEDISGVVKSVYG